MTALAWAGRACQGRLPARRPTELLALLRRPAQEWLPGAGPEPLLVGDGATDYALDLVAEGGESPEAERVQEQIGQTRRVFATRSTGDLEYRQFRRFLIEHGYASQREALNALVPSGLAWGEVFEEIPASCRQHVGEQDVFYPCPRCRWPLPTHSELLECPALACRQAGSRFRLVAGTVTALSGFPAPAPITVHNQVRLRRGIWRYTLLPGLAELELEERLVRAGAVVELWPEQDRYDLQVTAAACQWQIDVKDWSSGAALAAHLLRKESPDKVSIVVPDARSYQLAVLQDRCRHVAKEFCTLTQLVRTVTEVLRQQGGAL